VIYTSGSTGRPKGVEVPHGALSNFLASMAAAPGMTARDVLLSVTTVSFDIAALELFLPLVTGARVHVAGAEEAGSGPGLAALLRSSGATLMQGTPSTWRLLLEAGWAGDARLRILCGGEALSRDLADRLLERGAEVWNLYGPTETTVWSSLARVEPGPGPVPVGFPVAETRLYVLDAHGEPCPVGVPGEIHPASALQPLFGRLGLRDGDRVVVYGAANDPDAALVASVLRMHGFEASILDGGFERWTREQRPVTKDLVRPAASRPKAPRAKGVFATYEEVLAAARSAGGAAILDVRPPEQFEAGRIPGAVSMFWKRNLRPEDAPEAGTFRNVDELVEAYRAIGVTPDKTVYVYCNSGHMASLGWFVLKVLLDYPDVRLYDGSWIDWSSRPDAPKESGKPGEAKARAAVSVTSSPN
jgi:3-mercaptopyruvate sulfurtransferase SseA